jgi:hypothetical protein
VQIPSNIPKPVAPPPQDLKPEPAARVVPVVMGDASVILDPSVVLKMPAPVSSGPRLPNAVRSPTDLTGTLYTAAETPEDAEAAAHIARLTSQLGKAESGEHSVSWPLPKETADRRQQQPSEQALAREPKESLQVLRRGLEQSPMLAVANFAQALGLVPRPRGGQGASESAQKIPEKDSQFVQDGLKVLMHGQLIWDGELTPGVKAKVYREDTYGEDPKNPGGPLVKGTQISIEAELPTVGMVRIRGMQIADSVSVVVSPEQQAQAVLSQNFQQLKDHLVAAHLESVRVRLQSLAGESLT